MLRNNQYKKNSKNNKNQKVMVSKLKNKSTSRRLVKRKRQRKKLNMKKKLSLR
jgi:hypothetical protein